VNGAAVTPAVVQGYAEMRRVWKPGTTVDIEFPMPVERVKAHPLVEANAGRVALMRGPLVYCVESFDNETPVQVLSLPLDTELTAEFREDVLGGVAVIRGRALVEASPPGGLLYFPFSRRASVKQTPFTAIPYYANANRGPVDMLVWLPESGTAAR
jgi:DUF1680 family protein